MTRSQVYSSHPAVLQFAFYGFAVVYCGFAVCILQVLQFQIFWSKTKSKLQSSPFLNVY